MDEVFMLAVRKVIIKHSAAFLPQFYTATRMRHCFKFAPEETIVKRSILSVKSFSLVFFRCGYATKLKCMYCRSTFLFFNELAYILSNRLPTQLNGQTIAI